MQQARQKIIGLWAILVLWLAGCDGGKPDSRPAFDVDPLKPFHLEFGRGSGWHGLGVVIVDQTGDTFVTRIKKTGYESTTLVLSPSQVRELVDFVNKERLTHLGKSYTNNIHDGTQWVFWVTQGANTKSIYFSNNFPAPIERFSAFVDDLLKRAGIESATWAATDKRHDEALWKSIQ